MSKITILSYYDRIACFHTLRPFLLWKDQKIFHYTNSVNYCLTEDKNHVLVMVRWFLKPDIVDLELMQKLRDKYKRIIFFHDDAGGGIPRAQVLPFVDRFYQKALFRDRRIYRQSLYGKELFSEYAHKKYGINDPDPIERAPITDDLQLNKLRLSWNIGIGQFPKHKYRQRLAVALARLVDLRLVKSFYSKPKKIRELGKRVETDRNIPVHARLGMVSQPSLAHHRELILDKIGNDSRFVIEPVGQRQYNSELKHSLIVLSPFGWGELCFRDFEAVLSGALLMKPDMSHLETWPDIFKENETYIGFQWDASDLIDKVNFYLENHELRNTIVKNAENVYYDQLNSLNRYFENILQDIISGV